MIDMYVFDSREKKNEHIINYFQRHNIEFEIKKLDIADYCNTENPQIVIDRKQNLQELAQNLCSKDSSRFWKEIRNSSKQELRLIILIEHGGQIKSIQDVVNWKSKYSQINGKQLQAEMYRIGIAYNINWMFCDKRSTGRIIYEILKLDN